jgi:hypothetical protein
MWVMIVRTKERHSTAGAGADAVGTWLGCVLKPFKTSSAAPNAPNLSRLGSRRARDATAMAPARCTLTSWTRDMDEGWRRRSEGSRWRRCGGGERRARGTCGYFCRAAMTPSMAP